MTEDKSSSLTPPLQTNEYVLQWLDATAHRDEQFLAQLECRCGKNSPSFDLEQESRLGARASQNPNAVKLDRYNHVDSCTARINPAKGKHLTSKKSSVDELNTNNEYEYYHRAYIPPPALKETRTMNTKFTLPRPQEHTCDAPYNQGENASDIPSPSKKYARRQRHKTALDKYKFKGHTKKQRDNTTSGSKTRGCKNRRQKTGAVLNEEFNAPNVEPERLTLERCTSRGLFATGKSSATIEYRDLPDLTFSEMTFLSQRKKRNTSDLQSFVVKKPKHGTLKRAVQEFSDRFPNENGPLKSSEDDLPHQRYRVASLLELTYDRAHRATSDTLQYHENIQSPLLSQPYRAAEVQVDPARRRIASCRPFSKSDTASSTSTLQVSWPSSPECKSQGMFSAPALQPIRENQASPTRYGTGLKLPCGLSPEGYTRTALIRDQPGVWQRSKSADDNISIYSVGDLRALANRLDAVEEYRHSREDLDLLKHVSDGTRHQSTPDGYCGDHYLNRSSQLSDPPFRTQRETFHSHQGHVLRSRNDHLLGRSEHCRGCDAADFATGDEHKGNTWYLDSHRNSAQSQPRGAGFQNPVPEKGDLADRSMDGAHGWQYNSGRERYYSNMASPSSTRHTPLAPQRHSSYHPSIYGYATFSDLNERKFDNTFLVVDSIHAESTSSKQCRPNIGLTDVNNVDEVITDVAESQTPSSQHRLISFTPERSREGVIENIMPQTCFHDQCYANESDANKVLELGHKLAATDDVYDQPPFTGFDRPHLLY